MGDIGEPRAKGDLAQTPFAHLILYLHREGVSGTLCVDHRGLEVKLRVREGRIIAAKPIERGASLQQGLLPLCAVAEASYSFWDADLLEGASGVVRGTVDPRTFVTESLRQHARDEVVDAVLARYQGMIFQLAADVDLKRLGLRPQEVSVVETLIARPCDEATLIQRAALSTSEVRRLLYMLAIQKLVSVEPAAGPHTSGVRQAVSISPGWHASGGSAAPTAHAPSVPTPGRASSSVPARGSLPPSVRPSEALASARPGGSVPAWQKLASRRVGATSQPPSTHVPPMAPPPAEALDAAGKLLRIEQLCEGNGYDAALRLAEELVAEDASVAEHHAACAWVQLHMWAGDKIPRVLADTVTRALRIDPENVRALYVKGMILKRTGKPREARRYFAQVLALEPKHIDATRELRLARLRSNK